jgi:hypothetical protein
VDDVECEVQYMATKSWQKKIEMLENEENGCRKKKSSNKKLL